MKTILSILLLTLTISLSAQIDTTYSIFKSENFKTSVAPSVILGSTFAIVEFHGQNMTDKQCCMVAATGIITSVTCHFVIKSIRKKLKK